ncbi:hypothetical protein RAS1_23340 [Phycisphaerae bacterium RAS1]|nr:hypothetical protein RAS1_23340 [Phycisphaerae bacterium RAS1]
MRICLAIRCKGDNKIDDEFLGQSARLTEAVLPFRHMPFRSESWRNLGRNAALLCWSNDPGDSGEPLIHNYGTEPEQVWTISGRAQFHADRSVCGLRPEPDLHEQVAATRGCFSALAVDGESERVYAATGVTGVEPVYFAETAALSVVGTWADAVRVVASQSQTARYDAAALYSFVLAGYFCDDRTPYDGVRQLPAMTTIEFAPPPRGGGHGSTAVHPSPFFYATMKPRQRILMTSPMRL